MASAEYSVNPVSTPVLTRLTAIPPTYFREIFGLATSSASFSTGKPRLSHEADCLAKIPPVVAWGITMRGKSGGEFVAFERLCAGQPFGVGTAAHHGHVAPGDRCFPLGLQASISHQPRQHRHHRTARFQQRSSTNCSSSESKPPTTARRALTCSSAPSMTARIMLWCPRDCLVEVFSAGAVHYPSRRIMKPVAALVPGENDAKSNTLIY
ncbi:MAG: hypothetical protein IPM03_01725 [Sulfuritalea sp.]|nr:hypothetical protein [Sulfuritalea sp.]